MNEKDKKAMKILAGLGLMMFGVGVLADCRRAWKIKKREEIFNKLDEEWLLEQTAKLNNSGKDLTEIPGFWLED